ncbi:HK97 gp10 family phage protein [Asticcacaulis sp. ZE23SCel15]|uniref:HK97-gp10 family putative phage morphogenesis protein n=1 Tax=Asticcacaulis sp. ZE23SCel15 TaxID=3059027 RepID=UPI00265FF496|nr:HK97-gp10 family putative phage morphogenesis protein [Asticcacaulis sp. ZE23SCel15]WKL57240.1 HK97 gp10 family phage protein [Asticcacaulis sp. ZE23SCel15]
MARSRTKVRNLERVLRNMQRLPESVRRETATELRAGAQLMASRIKAHTPIGRGKNAGALRQSIGWSAGDPPATRATGAFRPKPSTVGGIEQFKIYSGLRYCVYAGDDRAFYARWVEFGTKAGTRDKTPMRDRLKRRGRRIDNRSGTYQHPGTRPNPFFFPVVRLYKKKLAGRVRRAGNKAFKAMGA